MNRVSLYPFTVAPNTISLNLYSPKNIVLKKSQVGTGKTSFVADFAEVTCERGERCLYFAFEESPSQIVRNMRSIGLDLQHFIDKELLKIDACRPMAYGLEMHLIAMRSLIDKFEPSIVIIDPISNLINVGTESNVQFMLTRLIDYLKLKGITAMCSSLVKNESTEGMSYAEGISSLMDTLINLRFFEINAESNVVFLSSSLEVCYIPTRSESTG